MYTTAEYAILVQLCRTLYTEAFASWRAAKLAIDAQADVSTRAFRDACLLAFEAVAPTSSEAERWARAALETREKADRERDAATLALLHRMGATWLTGVRVAWLASTVSREDGAHYVGRITDVDPDSATALVTVEGYDRGDHRSRVAIRRLKNAPNCSPLEAYQGRIY